MGVLLPYVVAPVAVALIFSNLFGDQLRPGQPAARLGRDRPDPVAQRPFASHVAIATMVNFRWTGYNALILLAAMQAVPRDFYEAARDRRRRPDAPVLLHHRAPAAADDHLRRHHLDDRRPADLRRAADLRPVRAGRGGPAVADADHLPLRLGWHQRNFGRASAVAWLLFLIIVVIAIVNYFVIRRIASPQGGGDDDRHHPDLRGGRPPQRARGGKDRQAGPACAPGQRHTPSSSWSCSRAPSRSGGRSSSAARTPRRSTADPGPLLPGGNFLENAATVVDTVPFWKALGNSVIVSTRRAGPRSSPSTLAGFAFAKLRFRGRTALLVFVIATMAVPTQLGVVPLFIVMAKLGWTGSLWAVIVPAWSPPSACSG